MKDVKNRFLDYVKINTKSDETTRKTPSTDGQLELGKILAEELKSIGVQDVTISEFGYVYGVVPSNVDKKVPKIGFIAHMDTSPDMSGENVKPQVVENYDGGDIVLNKELDIVLSPKTFEGMSRYKGHTLITTDGTTLLGADDKAGIAEIVTAVEYIIEHPEIKHGDIKIGFTPDEEIGEGADHFDVKRFDADFAYTVDGGTEGELEYENFNAGSAKITIHGRNVHPGSAKDKMVNSMLIANEYISMLPENERPETTEKYEGFYHLIDMKGEVEETTLAYIIRDFFDDGYDARMKNMQTIADKLNAKYGEGTVQVELKEQYRNMKSKVEPVMHIVDVAKKAIADTGVTPTIVPIRGGTDGAKLSFMGLPTPNLFTGGENFHGKFEYVSVDTMKKTVQVILNIIKAYAEEN